MNTGDNARFVVFYSTNKQWLVERAYRLCRNWHEAEDLAHAAFLKVYQRWDSLDRTGELRGYVGKLLVNGFIDARRKRSWSREVPVAEVPETPNQHSPESGGEVISMLSALPAAQRSIVFLRFCMDLDVAEVARRAGCSSGSVTSQSSRGLARLRDRLAAAG